MKVLLTGANGFVGSHILDQLRGRGVATAVLLRPNSNRAFIAAHLPHVEVCPGSITEPDSLSRALTGVSHVIHCAGATKALRTGDFFATNQAGTRNVVEAVNRHAGQVQRLVHLSSLAAAGPAGADSPAREADPPRPVSDYGRSKLAGETEVRQGCRTEFVILRPPGVYGPRDGEFLRLFKAVQSHVLPTFGGGRQALSLVFVKDLAEAAVTCLTHPAAAGKTFYVAAPEPLTARSLAEAIQSELNTWTLPLPLPTGALWLACAGQEMLSRLTGRANVLSRQKYSELRAPGWVCDPGLLRQTTGFECRTMLPAGLAQTHAWYREAGWL